MAISSQGTTFTFSGFSAHYTSIVVDEPQPEVVDMTSYGDAVGTRRLVPTGDIATPGRVRVDYIRLADTRAPLTISGMSGQLSISGPGISVSKQAVVDAATSEIAVGQFLRGSLNFVIIN